MPLQHDVFERRAAAQAAVRDQLERTGHSLYIMQDVKSRGWRNMTVPCQDFARQFTRHWSKDLMMSSLY